MDRRVQGESLLGISNIWTDESDGHPADPRNTRLERELIHERAAVAREAAKARGKQTGRPKALSGEQVGVARRMRENGESVATITKTLGISRATFYRALTD
ncbi:MULTISPECIES: helix-turn-helix domain-containing protein [Rhodococcus]|uniref:helix-turn-helix domain-containing protein n=1 Tax=Rhodococcus TaxID=1827 RepID=UPI0029434EF5|nr:MULTISPECIES: helix-turn-helix domain-containing protein [Rhodococcus]MDV8128803.1 helix-turn-helix domain-containing protein [Rhodococcus sp. IEGM 1304]WOI90289.1 helix-turn-helix domain-containing protein [Rhodococcus qingshengii]